MGKISDAFNKKIPSEQLIKKVAPKKNSLDLSDLLGEPEGTNVVDLDDLIPAPRKTRIPTKVVLFWTDWTCDCGRHYEMPTYGDVLTQIEILKFGKHSHFQYEHYLPACHCHLPREVETKHIRLRHCPSCLQEKTLLEHFNESKSA